MLAHRYFTLLVITALMAVALLAVREAFATAAVTSDVDSATRSYTSWAEAAESERTDSATHSYTAWTKEILCGMDPTYDVALDSATRSYTAMAKMVEAEEACR